MLIRGILNPHLQSLLARTRHTNTLVIADRGFPFWPGLETIDLSLVDGIPSVPQVLTAVLACWKVGPVFMAEEFYTVNDETARRPLLTALGNRVCTREPHMQFKLRVPHAVGLIRTGETTPYSNLILESA